MEGDFVGDFVEPLIKLGLRPKGDVVAISESLAEDAAGATTYQLQAAVRAIRRSRKFMTFPSIAECVEAIKAAPVRDLATEPPARPVPVQRSGDAPALVKARQYIDDYEAADARGRATMDRQQPNRYAASLAVVAAFDPYGRPRPFGRDEMNDEEARAIVTGILGSVAPTAVAAVDGKATRRVR